MTSYIGKSENHWFKPKLVNCLSYIATQMFYIGEQNGERVFGSYTGQESSISEMIVKKIKRHWSTFPFLESIHPSKCFKEGKPERANPYPGMILWSEVELDASRSPPLCLPGAWCILPASG